MSDSASSYAPVRGEGWEGETSLLKGRIPARSDIPIGRENAIRREELAEKWECSDRRARRIIAGFRAEPGDQEYAILSSSKAPAGYWRSNDLKELQAFIRETEKRARMDFVALRGAKKLKKRLDTSGQVTIDSVLGA